MKSVKIKAIAFACFLIAMFVMCMPIQVLAVTPLDEIQDYTIQVDMRSDGTMDIAYHVEWKVLNDTSDGPLSWVKIGIPNKNVDEIKAHTDNIKTIEYNKQDGRTYVYIYFDRDYHKNEIIKFDFSIHQSHMYVIDQEDHMLRYSFTPGWFDEIEVKSITVKWNKENVLKTGGEPTLDGDYYVWSGSLGFGEKLNTSVYYNLDVFEVSEDGQVQEDESDGIDGAAVVLIIIVVILFILLLIYLFGDDDYGSSSGFGGRTYRSTHIYTGGRSSCACVSSCACACACAGGGRAGCSKKDFYHTNLKSETVMKVLEEE